MPPPIRLMPYQVSTTGLFNPPSLHDSGLARATALYVLRRDTPAIDEPANGASRKPPPAARMSRPNSRSLVAGASDLPSGPAVIRLSLVTIKAGQSREKP